MKLYVSGPMTGKENYNRESFEETAVVLKQLGEHPITPFDLDTVEPVAYHDWIPNMKRDIKYLMGLDGVVVLDDWEESKGARIEVGLAVLMDMPVYKLSDEGFLEQLRVNALLDVYEYQNEEWGYYN